MQDFIKTTHRTKKTGPGQEEGGKVPGPDDLSSTAAAYLVNLLIQVGK